MPARPRTSSSRSDTAKRKAAEVVASDDTVVSIPEVKLLGSLYPVPSREERIAISAYWRAAQRQFATGHELDDWLAAEREIDAENGRQESR